MPRAIRRVGFDVVESARADGRNRRIPDWLRAVRWRGVLFSRSVPARVSSERVTLVPSDLTGGRSTGVPQWGCALRGGANVLLLWWVTMVRGNLPQATSCMQLLLCIEVCRSRLCMEPSLCVQRLRFLRRLLSCRVGSDSDIEKADRPSIRRAVSVV